MKKGNLLITLCLGILLASCQGTQLTKQSRGDLLQLRAEQYAQCKTAGDLDREYGFFPPSYRDVVSLEQFKGNRKFLPGETSVKSIEYEEGADRARVVVSTNIRFLGFEFKNAEIPQQWTYLDGQWYLDARRPSFRTLFPARESP